MLAPRWLAVSIAAHVALLGSAGYLRWEARPERSSPAVPVFWLADYPAPPSVTTVESVLAPAAIVPAESPPADPPQTASASAPRSTADEAAATVQRVEDRAEGEDDVESGEHAENPSVVDAADAPTPTAGSGPARAVIVRDIDWDAERRRAIESMRGQRMAEETYATFSRDVADEPDAREDEPVDIFDDPANRSRAPSLMAPGRAHSRLGQRIASLCNALTGGVGLFGLASVCADAPPRATLFASIKPRYLRARPVCSPYRANGDIEDAETTASADPRNVKCRLVVDEEEFGIAAEVSLSPSYDVAAAEANELEAAAADFPLALDGQYRRPTNGE
jgi:hypothetical protein